MQNRTPEEKRRELRRWWVAERDTWRIWAKTQVAHADHPDHRVRWHIDDCLNGARERMRRVAAQRMSIAARLERAEKSSSLRRLGRLCARWREEAVAMDEIADEEGDDECILALECRERSRTLRDCANALEREWAGTEPTIVLSNQEPHK